MISTTTKPRIQPTATRVEQSTQPDINERIRRITEVKLTEAGANRASIDRRLRELDEEWDMERALQTNFAIVNLLSITFGALAARPWFVISGIAGGFMLEHALKGWCPPLPILRRFGFRTAREIAHERYALKALLGDFRGSDAAHPSQAMKAAAVAPAAA
jgi:hypothetical protein